MARWMTLGTTEFKMAQPSCAGPPSFALRKPIDERRADTNPTSLAEKKGQLMSRHGRNLAAFLILLTPVMLALGVRETAAQGPAAAIAQPCPLRIETPLGTAKRLVVAASRSAHGRQAAERICRGLRRLAAGVDLLTDPGAESLASAEGPVIVVGNLADSRAVSGLKAPAIRRN